MENDFSAISKIKKIAETSYKIAANTEDQIMAKAYIALDPQKLLPFDVVRNSKQTLDEGVRASMELYERMCKIASETFKGQGIYLKDPYEHAYVIHQLAGEMLKNFIERRKANGRGTGQG